MKKLKGATSFEVAAPTCEEIIITESDMTSGTFKVNVEGITNIAAIKEIIIPVWSTENQSNIKWYSALRTGTDSFALTVDVKNHGYLEGQYIAHAYIKDITGNMYFVGGKTEEIKSVISTLAVENVEEKEITFRVIAKDAELVAGSRGIKFAVWSDLGGQDDLRWYSAIQDGGNYYYDIPVSNHKTLGKYYVHTYIEKENGQMVHLENITFGVSGKATGDIVAESIDGTNGTFILNLTNFSAPSGIETVVVPVWCAEDQSDIVWYAAEKVGEGTYKVEVSVKKHQNHFGTYKAHVYTTMGNKIQAFTCKTTIDIEASNYISTEDIGNGQFRVSVYNPTVSGTPTALSFPTWSVTNGQDDIVWYTGSNNGNNVWSTTVVGRKHKSPGTFTTHIYATVNGTSEFVGSTSFEVPESAIISEAEARVHNHAVNVLNGVGWNLSSAYWWTVNNITYHTWNEHLIPPAGYTREQWYAVWGYEQRRGNCFAYAATFCSMAKELGYDAQYIEGAVRNRNGSVARHGFVRIKLNGAYYICDPQLQMRYGAGYKFYMQPANATTVNYVY